MDIDPTGWLSNFHDGREREIAAALLESFMFINEAQTIKMLEMAFASLAVDPFVETLQGSGIEDKWREFRRRVLITFPTDDQDAPSSSGYLFVRHARQDLGLAEPQLLAPGKLIERVASLTLATPIVFLDDIVGTGEQFCESWERQYEVNGVVTTLGAEAARLQAPVYYCPVVCTAAGLRAISATAPDVKVRPAHFLPDVYSASSPETILVPTEMRAELPGFISTVSRRAGVTRFQELGWGNLSLAIAFEHSVPDLTLPIFHSEKNGWKPLRKRR